jgi:CRP-like cAMP-binding protein
VVANRFLDQLPKATFSRLEPALETIQPPFGATLIEQNNPAEYVFFPLRGAAVSLTRTAQDGSMVEVGIVGWEGLAGTAALLDPGRQLDVAILQSGDGTMLRGRTSALRAAIDDDVTLRHAFFRYVNAFLMQIAQTALCNRLHVLEQRLIRWLLMLHERLGRDELRITQEFLSQMLGVRVAGVNEAIQSLERGGLITHARGMVTVLDRGRLEEAACECYEVVRREHERATASRQ